MFQYPQVVYKYRSWKDKFHKNILLENEIYFSPPKELNDPFDFRIHNNFHLLKTDEDRLAYANKIIKQSNVPPHEIESYRNSILRNLQNPKEEQKIFDEFFSKMYDSHYGIFSSSQLWDNILMWSHYGDNHRGICIGFYTQEFINNTGQSLYGYINYINDFPQISPIQNTDTNSIRLQFLSKSEDWSYEKEYRIIKIINNLDSRVYKINNSTIAEVILGANISEQDKNNITEIAKSKKIKLYQIQKKDHSFGFTRNEIE